MPEATKITVLFVCMGNCVRSQMAEALARHIASDVIAAESAGVRPLGFIDPTAKKVLDSRGISTDGQFSKGLHSHKLSKPDLIVNMSGLPGKGIAQHLVLRHRLAEKLLTDVIGLEWSRAHEEAERLEHGISPEVARLLLKRFGRDGRCPHGVPLFGGMPHLRRKYGAIKLSDAEVGHSYEIMRVHEKDARFLEFIERLRLRPGARLRLHDREYDETAAISVDGRTRHIHLGKPATQNIWVRRLAAA